MGFTNQLITIGPHIVHIYTSTGKIADLILVYGFTFFLLLSGNGVYSMPKIAEEEKGQTTNVCLGYSVFGQGHAFCYCLMLEYLPVYLHHPLKLDA